MSEPTLLTCGICGLVAIDNRSHHLTDCIDALRASLSTAEKENASLLGVVNALLLDRGDTRALECTACERWIFRGDATVVLDGCRSCQQLRDALVAYLYGEPAGDVPKAPPASDSSALEKALGALRVIARTGCIQDWYQEGWDAHAEDPVLNPRLVWCRDGAHSIYCSRAIAIDALSGGAHVDALKAPTNPATREE